MRQGIFVRTPPTSAHGPQGRFEFRIWPRGWPWAATRLQSRWALERGERRADIYLVTPFSPQTLLKLRGGARLEIKRRAPDMGLLQFWTCPVSTPFPLSRQSLAVIAQALGVNEGLRAEAGLSPAHLLTGLAACAQPVVPMTVRKARLVFRRGGCQAELCRATVAGRSRLTVAIEDPDRASTLCRIEELGLTDLPNRSYGDVLRPHRLPQERATR
ncbi:hypothetical protein [Sediminimonas qiaohouensis]|uniref:hypothetical protein n=1 Tax=Sediminimonas qiaohouensis TaxID=552061 RepID=UPI00047D618B|nr:hypothetical protein [Sediminimonas qiaohouensis]